MHGTMATNGLLRTHMQCCHDWRRLFDHRFWKVSCLLFCTQYVHCVFVLSMSVLSSACRICCGAASRHGIVGNLVSTQPRCADSPRLRMSNTAPINATMATDGLLRKQIQLCHDWRRHVQRRFRRVSFFSCSRFVNCLFASSMCVLCVRRAACVVALFHGTALWVISSPRNFGVLTHLTQLWCVDSPR